MASGSVPNPAKAVVATGNDERAVAVEIDGGDGIGMRGKDLETPGGLDVPDPDGLVEGAGDEGVAVGAEGGAEDVVGVAVEGLY